MTGSIAVAATIPNAPTGGRKPDIVRYSDAITPKCDVTGRNQEPTGLSGDTFMRHASTAMRRVHSIVPMNSDAVAGKQDLIGNITGIGKLQR